MMDNIIVKELKPCYLIGYQVVMAAYEIDSMKEPSRYHGKNMATRAAMLHISRDRLYTILNYSRLWI